MHDKYLIPTFEPYQITKSIMNYRSISSRFLSFAWEVESSGMALVSRERGSTYVVQSVSLDNRVIFAWSEGKQVKISMRKLFRGFMEKRWRFKQL